MSLFDYKYTKISVFLPIVIRKKICIKNCKIKKINHLANKEKNQNID